ncbi:MAG: VWA domain-containing protein [Gemmatimonas sp.]|nr:VWA domain-containing protein [Gemmatimonas sp.]
MGHAKLPLGGDSMMGLRADLLPVVAGVFLVLVLGGVAAYARRRRDVARAVADPDLLRDLVGSDLQAFPWRRAVPAFAAAVAIAGALLDPTLGTGAPARGGPVVLLLDVSGSMLVDDVGPRRLDLQRALADDLIDRTGSVPIGIVAFSGRAFTLAPPTRDAGALKMYVASLDPTIVTQSGSALGAAIRQGVALLGGNGAGGGGTLVLFGDGDETEDPDAAVAAARLAAGSGVTLHTVGVGTSAGGAVPALDLSTGNIEGYLRDAGGELIVSQVDDGLLRRLSRQTGGIHVSAADENAIDRLTGRFGATVGVAAREGAAMPIYAWLALSAFLILLLERGSAASRRLV